MSEFIIMNIKVSVIVPIYGVENHIEKCLISLFEQSMESIEFIFVNDNTKDNSMNILGEIINRYIHLKSRIKIVEHEINLGLSAARNTGLKLASGEYIIHLDSDDWVDSDLYEKMYLIAKEQNADIVCCNFKLIHKSYTEELRLPDDDNNFLDLNKLNFGLLYSSVCNKMVKKELYDKNNLKFFTGLNMWEDVGMMTRLRYHCEKVVFLDKELFYNYNKLNETSIVSVPKEENIIQQIKCAELLDSYLSNKTKDYVLAMHYLKFMAKNDYLFHSEIRNIKKWKNTNQESNLYIFNYSTLSLNRKIIAWMASKNYILLAESMLMLKKILLRVSGK